MNPAPLNDIGHVIQLAITPVFLLMAISTLIGVLTNRLARAVDRRRALAVALPTLAGRVADLANQEHELERRRARVIYSAISMAVLSAFCVATLIGLAFIDPFVSADLSALIALLFVLAMIALVGSLGLFLREISLALTSPRAPIR
jgi:Protein of unknown function (DUF2721)